MSIKKKFRHHTLDNKPKKHLTDEDMATIRRLNRERAKRMERDIASRLHADRTPMSGAGMVKGDGIVYLPNGHGIAVIECKVSASTSDTGIPQIPFVARWLTKLDSDVAAMRSLGARLGMLIVKMHYNREMYVFIKEHDAQTLAGYLELELPAHTGVVIARDKLLNGKLRSTFYITKPELNSVVNGAYVMPNATYRVFSFDTITEWFDNVTR